MELRQQNTAATFTSINIHLVSKKTVQICFCQIIFGTKIAKRLKLYAVHSLSTSPNSRHHTTVLNADVSKCYRTLKVDICNKLSNNLVSTQLKCVLFNRIISSYKVWLKIVRNCQNLCMNCLKIKWSRNVLFAASQGWRRKREAAFVASREYVTVQRLKGLNAMLSAIFSVECLIPSHLRTFKVSGLN